jgi:hypothetical protein
MHADDATMDKRAAADVPKEIAEITNPMIDVPATQFTFYFIDDTAHTVTVPNRADLETPVPMDWATDPDENRCVFRYRGLTTTIEMRNVKYSEVRTTTMRVRKEQAK